MALQWAVNDSGNAARTQVVHTLARRMGLPFGTVREGLRTYAAKPGKLSYELVSEGGYLSLRSFAADQRRAGVSARGRRPKPVLFAGQGKGTRAVGGDAAAVCRVA
jgi:hypothetical protein